MSQLQANTYRRLFRSKNGSRKIKILTNIGWDHDDTLFVRPPAMTKLMT